MIFNIGDKVVHVDRPDQGVGTVTRYDSLSGRRILYGVQWPARLRTLAYRAADLTLVEEIPETFPTESETADDYPLQTTKARVEVSVVTRDWEAMNRLKDRIFKLEEELMSTRAERDHALSRKQAILQAVVEYNNG